MIVLLHVVIALSSIGYATFAAIAPTQTKLRVSAGLVAATLASGTYLVWSTHSPLLSACTAGLCYLAAVSALIAVAYRRFARQTID